MKITLEEKKNHVSIGFIKECYMERESRELLQEKRALWPRPTSPCSWRFPTYVNIIKNLIDPAMKKPFLELSEAF